MQRQTSTNQRDAPGQDTGRSQSHLSRISLLSYILTKLSFWGSPCVPPVPRAPPPRPAVSCSSRCRPAVPLAMSGRPSAPWPGVPPPQFPHCAGPGPPAGPGGFVHPRGSPPPFLQEGLGGRCSGWDALRLRGSLGYAGRCLLYRSPCPAALGLASPRQSPQHARPVPPQARGLCRPRGRPPCVPPGGVGRPLLGLGRSAPPRVVGARRPMPSWPTAVCPCGPSGSASPHGRLRGGPGGPVLFSAVPPSGALSHSALAPYPGSPPRPLLTACPPLSRVGAGPAVLLPAYCCGRVGGHLGCSVCVACRVVVSSLVVLWGGSPGLLNPTLTPAAFPLARAQGWVFTCVLMHVSCARLSPCGWTCTGSCVSGCVHVCVCQSSLFCCPPAICISRRAQPVEDLPLLHGSARLLAYFCLR